MTTQDQAALLLLGLRNAQLIGTQLADADGDVYVPAPPDSSLWTDGLPDPDKIKRKMDQTAQAFINHVYPPIDAGPFHYMRLIRQRKLVQDEFYATMSYYESLLPVMPVLPLPAETSTTTVVSYEPPAKRKRGRPATGRKPRASRRNTDADPY